MKKTKNLIFMAIFSICCFLGINASANDFDFYEEKSFTGENAEELAKQELQAQLERAKEFEESLDECSDLEILEENTGIITEIEDLPEERVETSEERDEIIAKHNENGYVVDFVSIEEDPEATTYSFEVENGVIKGAKVDGEDATTYVGENLVDVLANFKNEEVEDYKIVYTTETIVEDVIDTTTLKTSNELQAEITRLEDLGYTVTWVQNDNDVKTENLVYETTKTEAEIKAELEKANLEEEVKDVVVNGTTEIKKEKYVSEKFDALEKATNEKNRLNGIYDEVSDIKTETVTDKDNVTKVKEKVEVTEEVDFDLPYTLEIENGYRVYNKEENVLLEKADYVNIPNYETEAACIAKRDEYRALGYTAECKPVESTTVESTTNNTYYFNNTKESTTKRYSHLDISANQTINILNEKGEIVDTVRGTLSNVSGSFVRNGETIRLVYPSNVSSDGGRLEFCQSNSTDRHCGGWGSSSGNFYITNQELVTINATLTYTYNGEEKTKNIILVGYLKDALNECRQSSSFDFKLDFDLDVNGNIVLNIGSDTTWTLEAEKEAQYGDKVYYDEYQYGTKTLYYVEANNIDYSYNVSYVATDYNLTYTGSTSTVTVVEDYYDRDFIINGNKTTYIVRTTAMIVDNGTCGIGDEGEPVLPPHTGLEANTLISYNNVAIIEDKKRRK